MRDITFVSLAVHLLTFSSPAKHVGVSLQQRNSLPVTAATTTTTTDSSTSLWAKAPDSSATDGLVQDLRQELQESSESSSSDIESAKNERIKGILKDLEERNRADIDDNQSPDFDPLLGYYNVTATITAKPKDNPVGGKWTRKRRQGSKKSSFQLIQIVRTLQHLLPPTPTDDKSGSVAQAVNVIKLLLLQRIPIWIVLRGDAYVVTQEERQMANERKAESDDSSSKKKKKKQGLPLLPGLSPLAVRAFFDPPRIGIGASKRFSLTLGPTSSVVLDTPFYYPPKEDDAPAIRVGKGGTSGSYFVFSKLLDSDWEGTEEWKWLLAKGQSGWSKRQLAVSFASISVLSALLAKAILTKFSTKLVGRVLGKLSWTSSLAALLGFVGVLVSTGGIETRGPSYMPGNKELQEKDGAAPIE